MSNYTITTDFGAKDDLPSGNASKVIKGSEFTTEFTNIKTAVNSKADSDAPTFTGATTFSGTVTLNNDVTFDTNTMFVDVSTNRVGIGTTSPATNLHVSGSNSPARFSDDGTGFGLDIEHDTANGITTLQQTNSGGDLRLQGGSASGLLFFETSGSERMRIDSSGNVGIGTASPATALDVTGNVTADGLTVDGDATVQSTSGNTSTFLLGQSGVRNWRFQNIATTGELQVKSTPTTTAFEIDTNGDISFYEDTGTTPKLFWDASAERLGIGTNTPSAVLDVVGTKIQLTGANPEIVLNDNTNTNTCIIKNNDGSLDYKADQNNEQGLSRHRFYTDGTQRMEIEANGNVGIGTTSPTGHLTVFNSIAPVIKLQNSATGSATGDGLQFYVSGATGYVDHKENGSLLFNVNGSERMRIDSSGNVGIGTSSPDTLLNLAGDETAVIRLENTNGSVSDGDVIGALQFYKADGSGAGAGVVGQIKMLTQGVGSGGHLTLSTGDSSGNDVERVRINSNGNVGIGTTSPAYPLDIVGASGTTLSVRNTSTVSSILLSNGSSANQIFSRGANSSTGRDLAFVQGTSEAMRIDSSGNLLVGKTSDAFEVEGMSFRGSPTNNASTATFTRDGSNVAAFNRLTNNGSVLTFYKDGTTVGSISVTSSATAYNTSSDERLKENITDSTDAGSKVDAIQIRQFDWKSDGSHQDYGVIAQELINVAPEAVSEGETEEDMMGVDYSKLVPMLIKEIQTLRNRVAQLENN